MELSSALDGWLQKTEHFSDLCPLLYPRCQQKLEGEKVKAEKECWLNICLLLSKSVVSKTSFTKYQISMKYIHFEFVNGSHLGKPSFKKKPNFMK